MPATGDAIRKGMARAAKFGRKPGRRGYVIPDAEIRKVMHLGTAEAARKLGMSKAWYIERRRRLEDQNEQ